MVAAAAAALETALEMVFADALAGAAVRDSIVVGCLWSLLLGPAEFCRMPIGRVSLGAEKGGGVGKGTLARVDGSDGEPIEPVDERLSELPGSTA